MKQMHRMFSRVSLVTGLMVFTMVVAACATLPPITAGTPAAALPTSESTTGAAATPTAPAPGSPLPGSTSAVDNAVQTLATQLGIKAEDVKVVSSGQVDWPNGCLGVQRPGIMCTDAIVPGYQVMLEVGGKQYEMRTDLSGQVVVLAPEGVGMAALPEAAVRARERAAVDLGLELGLVRIVSAEQVQWPDACLGVPDPAELCAPQATPGYRVTVETNDTQYVYHTDETGQNIRRERQAPTASNVPPAATRGA